MNLPGFIPNHISGHDLAEKPQKACCIGIEGRKDPRRAIHNPGSNMPDARMFPQGLEGHLSYLRIGKCIGPPDLKGSVVGVGIFDVACHLSRKICRVNRVDTRFPRSHKVGASLVSLLKKFLYIIENA